VKPRVGQLGLTSMPQRLFVATPSRLAAFDCPRRYRLTYLDRPAPAKGPPWAHNTVGATVHLALARWWQLRLPQRTPANGGILVRRHWTSDGFADQAQSEAWREQAAGWVERYLADETRRSPTASRDVDPQLTATEAGTRVIEPRGVERTVSMRTARLAVSGRVDRIDERDGDLVIVDYKTGRSAVNDTGAAGSTALALYALAAERTLRQRCRRVELHHLPTGQIARFEHTNESLARHVERAEQTAIDIQAAIHTVEGGADADDVFEARPSVLCSWCDYRRVCPEGRAASIVKDAWSGLGTLPGVSPSRASPE
jgi:putative RecB family exonuclease